jgi:hypothetical protein
MPRFIYLLGLGLALIGLALAVTDWVIGTAPGVTEANVRRIRPGMTLEQVEAILGQDHWPAGGFGTIHFSMSEKIWHGADGSASVWFESSLRAPRPVVESAHFRRTAGPRPLERLRSWLWP